MQACTACVRTQCLHRGLATARAACCSPRTRCTSCICSRVQHANLNASRLLQQATRTNLQTNHARQVHMQWRCNASKVRDMPEKQLQETKDAANAAADDPGANDHFDKILDSLQADATNRMDSAVANTQNSVAKIKVAGKAHEQHDDDVRKLKQTSEDGKVAVRNIRRQVMQKIGKLARDRDISPDDQDRMADRIQQLTDEQVDGIEKMKQAKQA